MTVLRIAGFTRDGETLVAAEDVPVPLGGAAIDAAESLAIVSGETPEHVEQAAPQE